MNIRIILLLMISFIFWSCEQEKQTTHKPTEEIAVKTAVRTISSVDDFDTLIHQKGKVYLVDMYADWCAPCKTLEPILDKLSLEYKRSNPKVSFLKVNLDNYPTIKARYKVDKIPLILLIKEGVVIEQILGIKPASAYKEAISSAL